MFNSYHANYKTTKTNRPPVCTLKEFSVTTGIPYATLYDRMTATDSPPEVKLKVKMNKFYEISELKKWLQSYT